MNKNKVIEIIGAIFVIALTAIVLYGLLLSYQSCSDEGGTLVRGPYWYECVDKEGAQ